MTKVLVITGILPVSVIERRKTENDILLVIEDQVRKRYPNISFRYIFTFPYANRLLSKLSLRWRSYYELKKKDTYILRDRELFTLPIMLLPRKFLIRSFLYRISLFLYKKKIENLIISFKPDILHAQNTDIDAFVARKISEKYNIPYVITLRGLDKCKDTLVKKNIEKSSRLVALSPRQLFEEQEIFRREIDLIPHGVEDSFFKVPTNPDKIETPFVRLITICRFLHWKNIDLIIKSIKDFPNIILDIVGDGPEKRNLEQLIIQERLTDRVRFLGFLPHEQLVNYLRDYDLFVLLSYPETFGRVYLEAMAAGLPVMCSAKSGVDGIITHGKEGFLVNHKSITDIQNIFKDMLNKEQLFIMGQQARVLASQFTWDSIGKKYFNLYSSI